MGLNSTPSGERTHIGIFGRRNAGKSSLINAMTGQDLAIVSNVEGTTTDPVKKSLELLPLGPVVLIDTPGIDDQGEIGDLRVRKSYQILNKTDIAILVINGTEGIFKEDIRLFNKIKEKNIPCIIALNQSDRADRSIREKTAEEIKKALDCGKSPVLWVSALTGENIDVLKETAAGIVPEEEKGKHLAADILPKGKFTVLVIPIDKAAPKGRLILPQQQTIRDILDAGETVTAVRDDRLQETLEKLGDLTGLVITDSQVFEKVAKIVPESVPLTSFSILFARYKGELESMVKGAQAIDRLEDGDKVLISEGCTHHRQCNDIGTVKIPGWIREYTGREPEFSFTSGGSFPEDISKYRLIVHCGGCMLNEREMKYRIRCARDSGVPMTNYGMLISHIKGILERSIRPFM